MELSQVFGARKSIRSFTGAPASEVELKKIIRAANASPVGLGKYGSVHLTLVKSRPLLDEIEQNTARVFNSEPRSFLYGAPQLIIVSTAAVDNVGCSNAAIIAHDMALSAVDLGLGVCHIWGATIALAQNAALVSRLGIPAGFTPTCAVALGVTDERYTEREIPEDRIALNIV